jgi:hypothetical protein
MPYCDRHLAVGIEIKTNRHLAGWPICDDCLNGKPVTREEIEARLASGTALLPRGFPWGARRSTSTASNWPMSTRRVQL